MITCADDSDNHDDNDHERDRSADEQKSSSPLGGFLLPFDLFDLRAAGLCGLLFRLWWHGC